MLDIPTETFIQLRFIQLRFMNAASPSYINVPVYNSAVNVTLLNLKSQTALG